MRVLYLAGLGRNGSTIVSNVLNTVPGTFAVGEVRSIWSHGYAKGALCGCGVPVPDCGVWSSIAHKHLGGIDQTRARKLAGLHGTIVKLRHLPALTRGGVPRGLQSELAAYQETLSQLYTGIHDVTGCDVIIDSSKAPTYAAVLARIDGIDLRTVHQVRDARASAHSWTRERAHTDLEGAMMPQYSPWKTALLWDSWNLGSERLTSSPYMRIRYEDFVADPRRAVRNVLDFAGLHDRDADWTGERSVSIAGHHMIHGNPSRGKTGSIELRADDGWIDAFPRSSEAVIAPIVLPLQLRYGYPVRRPSSIR